MPAIFCSSVSIREKSSLFLRPAPLPSLLDYIARTVLIQLHVFPRAYFCLYYCLYYPRPWCPTACTNLAPFGLGQTACPKRLAPCQSRREPRRACASLVLSLLLLFHCVFFESFTALLLICSSAITLVGSSGSDASQGYSAAFPTRKENHFRLGCASHLIAAFRNFFCHIRPALFSCHADHRRDARSDAARDAASAGDGDGGYTE
jgi:hypothetical protein